MTHHLHLLITPQQKDGISGALQTVGRRHVKYVKASGRRSGTQWEGRHKASLIDAEHYLLTCYRYIALNPPRAGSVRKPVDWLRSSCQANAYGKDDQPTKPHDVDLALGACWNHSRPPLFA